MKDRMIKSLLNVGKKHRILVFPTLAIVAVITAFSHLIYWGRGNGRKVVASVMIMTMLITQSVFLTSSANVSDGQDGMNVASPTDGSEIMELATSTDSVDSMTFNTGASTPVAPTVLLHRVDESGTAYSVMMDGYDSGYIDNNNGTVTINVPAIDAVKQWAHGDYAEHFNVIAICSDQACSIAASGTTIILPKDSSNTYNLYFKSTRISYPILINGYGEMVNFTDKVTVPNATLGDINPSCVYTVGNAAGYNAYAFGWLYQGLKYEGVEYTEGNQINIAPTSENVSVIQMDTLWLGMDFEITYKAREDSATHIVVDGAETKNERYRYGMDIRLWTAENDNMVGWTKNDGYYLSGWSDGSSIYGVGENATVTSTVFADNMDISDITSNPNIVGKTLTAVWTYKSIELQIVSNGQGTITPTADGGIVISGTYGDSIDCVISAKYKTDGMSGEKFRYSLSDDAKNTLAGYGLNVTENSNGSNVESYSISGVINKTTTEQGISVPLIITDNNKPADSNTSTHSIALVAVPKEVTLDVATVLNEAGDGKPSKTYDGTTEIAVNQRAEVNGKLLNDDVYISYDRIASLDNPNAGKGKTITVSNVTLAGAKAGEYKLAGLGDDKKLVIENAAQVDPKSISVSVDLAANNDAVVLFGEADPTYVITLDPTMLTAGDRLKYDGLTNDEERMAFMRAYVGFTDFEVTRSIYSPEGTYSKTPIFADQGYNYAVSAAGLRKEFTVVRDSADGYYSAVGTPVTPVGGYYREYTITPANGYDKIRLISDGESDITLGMPKAEAEALFSNAININADMTDGHVKFQMLNSVTGAITYPTELSGINIDCTGPELVSYSVSPNVKYFNEFGFGAYYHSQKIEGVQVESVSITFEFKASDSNCEYIKYYFADENGERKEEFSGEIKAVKDATTGNYKGTVTIGTGASGQLIVYALDTTGNSSKQSQVRLQEIVDFVTTSENSTDYYEWMVENIISASDIVVTDTLGNNAAAGVWTNGINMSVGAVDDDSGVWKLDWVITNPAGEETIITEEVDSGRVESVVFATQYGKVTKYNFNESLTGENLAVGKYSIGATLYDNAGNSIVLDVKGPYLIDTYSPRIKCEGYQGNVDSYLSGVTLKFTATEPVEESGIASVKLYKDTEDDAGLLKTWGPEASYEYNVAENGTYIIVVTDNAGNVSRESVTYAKISNTIPNAPILKVDGTVGNNSWYVSTIPSVTINNQKFTADGVPVTTYYRVTAGEKVLERSTNEETLVFDVTFEGDVKIEAWSRSESGKESELAVLKLKVDTEAPDAYITEASVNNEGKPVINFKAQDDVSGVDADAVYVNGKKIEVVNDGGYISGSFVVEDSKEYKITVEDMAGNVYDKLQFVPLSINSSAVTGITPSGAYIDAQIYEGTSAIAEAKIEYKLSTDSEYDICLSNKSEEDYGINLKYQFRNLQPDTVYDYRIYATTKGTKEVKVVEGSFRTSDSKSTATVYGTVTYDEKTPDVYKTYPVYIALYEANTIVAGMNLESEEEVRYTFKNVPNGTYRVVATNGVLNEVTYVTVENGGISYPTDYAANGGINLVLDGFNTNVVIEDNVINLSADGLEKIYNTELYNGNVTDDDLEVVKNGGTIDITLHANYIDVSDVGQSLQTIFTDKLGTTGVVERYIQLYVIKEVRDSNGRLVNGTPMNITRLAEPVSISFPLGDLAGKQIYVASLHGSDTNYKFINWGPDAGAALTRDYVVISTDRFSVFALYRLIEEPKEYTVKWIDGNGKVMKTEKVKEGSAATPPITVPVKTETSEYVYTFSGWSTDYSSIKKDTNIFAWFSAKEKDKKPEEPTTETPTTEAPTTEAPTTEKPTPEEPTTQAPTTETDKDDITKEPVNYPYMGSVDSPKTGDDAPILGMIMLMLISGAGLAVVGNRKKNQN